MKEEVLRISSLYKSLEGTSILENFNLHLYKGEILGILGLNEAGKTTLLKIAAGHEKFDQGSIFLNEKKLIGNRVLARNKIALVQKQSSLVDNLTVADNILVLRKHYHRKLFVHKRLIENQVKQHFKDLQLDIPFRIKAEALRGTDRSIVEIVKAYILGAQIILIDDFAQEHTLRENLAVADVVKTLRTRGVSFVLTSQQIEPLATCSDRILLLSNKRAIKAIENKGEPIDASKLFMTPQLQTMDTSRKGRVRDTVVFSAEDIQTEKLRSVSFKLYEGEITLIVDPLKNSMDELYEILQEPHQILGGSFTILGEKYSEAGLRRNNWRLAFTDFNMSGKIVNYLSVRDNLCLSSYGRLFKRGFINRKTVRYIGKEFAAWHGDESLAHLERCVGLNESDKIAIYLYRLQFQKTRILFCIDPGMVTDYNTSQMVEEYLKDVANKGIAICIFTSSSDRLYDIADRILIMQEGRLMHEHG